MATSIIAVAEVIRTTTERRVAWHDNLFVLNMSISTIIMITKPKKETYSSSKKTGPLKNSFTHSYIAPEDKHKL